MDHFFNPFLDLFMNQFLDHFIGGVKPLVLREGWDVVYQYSERGSKQTARGGGRTISTRGELGGCCISK